MFAFQNYNLVLVLQIVSLILNAALNSTTFQSLSFQDDLQNSKYQEYAIQTEDWSHL